MMMRIASIIIDGCDDTAMIGHLVASRVHRMKVNNKRIQQSDKFKAGRRAKRMSEYFGHCLLFPLLHI